MSARFGVSLLVLLVPAAVFLPDALAARDPDAPPKLPLLKEVWRADGLVGQAIELGDETHKWVASFAPDTTTTLRDLLLFDPQTGVVQWRTPTVKDVGWASMSVGEEGIALTGTYVSQEATELALVDLRSGRFVWHRPAAVGETLGFGAQGGLTAATACGLSVLNPATGEVWEKVPGRSATVEAGADTKQILCVARPRLLGTVADEPVVLSPEPRAPGWRLYALHGMRPTWEVSLGPVDASPELDWATSTFWTFTEGGLHLTRRNLGNGKRSWDSEYPAANCTWDVRAVAGPRGAPMLLLRACDVVTALDPHDGGELWRIDLTSGPTVAEPNVQVAIVGEPPVFPERLQPRTEGQVVRWLTPEGNDAGLTHVPAGASAVPYGAGLLIREPTSISLRSRADAEVWRLPLVVTDWSLREDLLFVTVSGTPGRVVLGADTGEVAGRYEPDAAPITLVPQPGTNRSRLLIVSGDGLRALRVPARAGTTGG